MSDNNHIEKIKAEQKELLKQFEQSLQDNFKRLMSNTSKANDNKVQESDSNDDEIDSDEDFKEIEKQVTQNMVTNNAAKNYDELFEESSKSEASKNEKKEKAKDEEEESNSGMEMVSKFSADKEDVMDDSKNKNDDKRQKDYQTNTKIVKARTQSELNKPQLSKTRTSDLRNGSAIRRTAQSGTRSGSIPLRSKTPQVSAPNQKVLPVLRPNNATAKYKANYISHKSGTLSATNNNQKEIFNNSKLNTSVNKKPRTSVVSGYSNREDKNTVDYKAKYEKLNRDHTNLKDKFSSLYDKHQRLLKLFNKLEEKYRAQADKLRATTKTHSQTRPATTKVTVPKTMSRPKSGRRPTEQRKN